MAGSNSSSSSSSSVTFTASSSSSSDPHRSDSSPLLSSETNNTSSSTKYSRPPTPYPSPSRSTTQIQSYINESALLCTLLSIAKHAGAKARGAVKVSVRSISASRERNGRRRGGGKPKMEEMKVVTPVYDHGKRMWVWPVEVRVHVDEGR